MRSVLGMTLLAVGAGATSCGNCDYRVNEFNGNTQYTRIGCNTGNTADRVPYPPGTTATGTNASLTFNGTSTAQVATIAEIKTAVGATPWAMSFCGTYLDRYTDGQGSLRGEGAACMRSYSNTTTTITAAAFKQADDEARALFQMFGTTNGYASSFAVSNGGVGSQVTQWGTGRTGDVPTNWCGVYMREMLCQIAFPQIAVQKNTLATLLAAGRATGGVPYTAQSVLNTTTNTQTHFIRTVELDSCETMFDVCNRREPTTDEKGSAYRPSILNNKRAPAFRISQVRKLESDAFCIMWRQGFGLGQAGSSIGDSNIQASFESGYMTVFSPVLLVVALLVVMF